MYNEEKKLITDIQRKKDLDRNLALFAGVASKANYEYACHKFTLNYLTLKDMHMDGDVPDDPYIAQCQTVIDKLIGDFVVGDKTVCEDADMKLISDVRNTITAKMKVLTSYTDAFEMYEYILNRKEYSYPENVDEEVQKELKELDEAGVSDFAEEIYRFVFADQDKVAINSKLQSIIGQLPIRMTKNRFYDILGETLDIYNGVEKESLDQFIEMIENTALIRLPEGFETEYPELYEALEVLKAGDYTALDYDGYRKLTDVLDRSAAFLNSVVTEYMLIIELVNDLYVMMLALDSKEGVSESCKKAMTVIEKAVADDGEHLEDVYALLDDIVGEQEQAGEHKVMLESAVYDISTGYTDDIAANELQDTYRDLEIMDKLLSGSMFVDIDNIAVMGVLNVDTDYIAACKEKLTNEFADLFAANSMTVNRAIMAKILSNIPVFFNTTDEIREYVNGSLSRCREKSELLADYIVIKQMMEE